MLNRKQKSPHAKSDRVAVYARLRAERRAHRKAHPYICQWCTRPIEPEQWPKQRKYHPACRAVRDRTFLSLAYVVNHRKAARAWQERKRQAGRCVSCGKPRGKRGTASLCRPCADKRNRRRRRGEGRQGEVANGASRREIPTTSRGFVEP
ncbi:MAG TPA: hypothetical protein VMG58_03675 [Candidatus Sulfotelmatobacter sp.]|nr:hypothetical protein [Candidatus Sulfotelmatobacter sp.]